MAHRLQQAWEEQALPLRELVHLAASRSPVDQAKSLLQRLGEHRPSFPTIPSHVNNPCWHIGSFKLQLEHFMEAAAGQTPMMFLDVAIEGYNAGEIHSICLPLTFMTMDQETKRSTVIAAVLTKVGSQSADRFLRLFWQSPWQVLIPVTENSAIENVIGVFNEYNGTIWVPVITNMYPIHGVLSDTGEEVLRIIQSNFSMVKTNIEGKCENRGPVMALKERQSVIAGRFLGLLFTPTKSAWEVLSDDTASALTVHLHQWIVNAVYNNNNNCKGTTSVVCCFPGCSQKLWRQPRGSLATWFEIEFVCAHMGAACQPLHYGDDHDDEGGHDYIPGICPVCLKVWQVDNPAIAFDGLAPGAIKLGNKHRKAILDSHKDCAPWWATVDASAWYTLNLTTSKGLSVKKQKVNIRDITIPRYLFRLLKKSMMTGTNTNLGDCLLDDTNIDSWIEGIFDQALKGELTIRFRN